MMKLIRKEARGKTKELVFKRWSWLIHHFQNATHQKIYTFWNCVHNDEVPSTSSKIVEQIEIIQGVVLPGISKLNDSAQTRNQKKTHFHQKMTLEKGKWIWYCLLYLLSHQLMDRTIEYSIHQLYKTFFICLEIFVMIWGRNSWEKIKKEWILQYDHDVRKFCFVIFTALRFPYVVICPNLMTVQTSKGKVPYIYKELIRRIMTFEYEKVLVSNIVITKQNKASQTYYIRQEHFEKKLLILQTSQQSNLWKILYCIMVIMMIANKLWWVYLMYCFWN